MAGNVDNRGPSNSEDADVIRHSLDGNDEPPATHSTKIKKKAAKVKSHSDLSGSVEAGTEADETDVKHQTKGPKKTKAETEEYLALCKRELQSMSNGLKAEARLVMNDVCAQIATQSQSFQIEAVNSLRREALLVIAERCAPGANAQEIALAPLTMPMVISTPARDNTDTTKEEKAPLLDATKVADTDCIKAEYGKVSPLPGINDEDSFEWKVVFDEIVNVRETADLEASPIGCKHPGDSVRGRDFGEWVELVGEPGYIIKISPATGVPILRKKATIAERQISAGSAQTGNSSEMQPHFKKELSQSMLFTVLPRRSAYLEKTPEAMRDTIVARLVMNEGFDYVFGVILVLNAIVMGLQIDWEAMNLGQEPPAIYAALDLSFCIAFLIELALRCYVLRAQYYIQPGWQWAYFDTAIVTMQVVEELLKLIQSVTGGGGTDDTGGVSRLLKLLKIGRLMRMVRMVRLIPELKSTVYLILASMSSFFWTILLLFMMIYSIAVYMTMMATDARLKPKGGSLQDQDDVYQYWGSLGDSILSLSWSILGGQDWADLIQPLVNQTGNQIHNMIYLMYIAFATMVLMNLVTGVFVEGAQRLTREDKDREVLRMAYKTFNKVDHDGDIEITINELQANMEDGAMDTYLEAINLKRQDCLDLFKLLDEDGSGTINLQEFTQGCLKLRGQARAADLAQLLVDVKDLRKEFSESMKSLRTICKDRQPASK